MDALRGTEEITPKRLLNKGLKKPALKFNSGLELIGLGTTRPSAQFDDACTSIISLYSLLHSDRDAIPEVPAIYFVLPSEENVKRICQVGDILIYYLN